MTETPEQRRERLEAAVWQRLTFEPCEEPCWTWSNPIRQGCACVIHIADAIIASDLAAGVVCVPREATPEMTEAAWRCNAISFPAVYRAMIDAAQGKPVGSE